MRANQIPLERHFILAQYDVDSIAIDARCAWCSLLESVE